MSLTKEQKKDTIEQVEKSLKDAVSVAFVSFDGLTIKEVNDLRAQLFEVGSKMRVIPKRLLKLVMGNLKLEFDPKAHSGQVAVIWGDDAVAPAKAVHTFAKTSEHLTLIGGALEGKDLSQEQISALASLPSKQELLGQLVGTIAGPMRGMVTVFSGVQRSTVQVLKAIADSKS